MALSDQASHTKQVVLTIFPFEQSALVVCGANVPEQMLFGIRTRPPIPLVPLCAWQEHHSSPRLLILILLVKRDIPLALIPHLRESELGQLRLQPASQPVLFTYSQVCEQWQIDLRLRVSDPFSSSEPSRAGG